MEIKFVRRAGRVIVHLPDVYRLQPESDYQALISHSPSEIVAKAWGRTGKQMIQALKSVEKRFPDVKRKLATTV
ncbi:MAG: hypothetical protein RBS05_07560 [Zoogloea oleivorans]|mgnify:FL=1|jgi:hypothetical protein|uniref:hypothetical protein n=1 Tax=Zoogloea oleivorans TaxID=1552750 RepID=UPI002A367D7A|nr:hypothetical protein [Zoogloea oleivorans]MDY0035745.1 hypothetical protein [Zoogloea oleivorans]